MSQIASEEATVDRSEDETKTESDPEIEEDLVSEELRIDGICGVY